MAETYHGKLVRDKIPEIIVENGEVPTYRIIDGDEKAFEARKKLVEEAEEVRDSEGDIGEYADVYEILLAAIKADGYTLEEVEAIRAEKAAKRGSFTLGIYLEKSTVKDVV